MIYIQKREESKFLKAIFQEKLIVLLERTTPCFIFVYSFILFLKFECMRTLIWPEYRFWFYWKGNQTNQQSKPESCSFILNYCTNLQRAQQHLLLDHPQQVSQALMGDQTSGQPELHHMEQDERDGFLLPFNSDPNMAHHPVWRGKKLLITQRSLTNTLV